MEYTLSIIKPDAVSKNLIGSVNKVIEEAGLEIVAQKMLNLSYEDAYRFYEVHAEKPFFESLVEFMTSGAVVVQILRGENAITKYRDVMGATNPADAKEGTIRKLFAESIDKNAVHGSDSEENATKEIFFFFSEREIVR